SRSDTRYRGNGPGVTEFAEGRRAVDDLIRGAGRPQPPHQRVGDGTGQGGGEAPGAEDLVRPAEVGPGAGVNRLSEAEPVVCLGGDPVRRAVTTTEPSSSPASAHLPPNASSSAILLHWQLSTYRHTSRGYQLSAALARVSPPVPSWKTAPPVTSANRCHGAASQSGTVTPPRGSNPSCPASQPPRPKTSTRCLMPLPGSRVTPNATG